MPDACVRSLANQRIVSARKVSHAPYSPKTAKGLRAHVGEVLPTVYKSPVLTSLIATVVLFAENGTTAVALPAATLTCLPFTWNVPVPPSVTEIVVAFASTEAV